MPFLLTFLVEGKMQKNHGLTKDRGKGAQGEIEYGSEQMNSYMDQRRKCGNRVFIQWKRKTFSNLSTNNLEVDPRQISGSEWVSYAQYRIRITNSQHEFIKNDLR